MKKILLSILVLIAIVGIAQYGFSGKKETTNTSENALKIGDMIPTFEIKDQFEKTHVISPDSKTIFVAGDMDSYKILRDFLLTKEEGFLKANNSNYLADITGMPSLVSEYIALPKMKKYTFSILLLDETQTNSFVTKPDILTAYTVTDGKISNMKFIETAEQLAAIFN